jgi:hypothetical protein
MVLPKVYADFHNLDDNNRIRLTCAGTLRDLERLSLRLHEGLVVRVYTDDADDDGNPDELFAHGVVQFNNEEQCWVAAIDWRAVCHASETAARHGQIAESHSIKTIPSG